MPGCFCLTDAETHGDRFGIQLPRLGVDRRYSDGQPVVAAEHRL
jgi:hypothetical protein